MGGLLDGVTVLDLASVGPAARASGWLADYGARVVKVGPVAADGDERLTPPRHAYAAGRGTQRIGVDLKRPAGREVFLRLAERADVVIESFRPGVVARLGIGYDDVKSRNPRIVYCSTTGYGQDGERSRWAGHDLDYLAVGGYLANTERLPGGKPPVPGATVADSAAGGLQAVAAILAALVARGRTGEGGYLDVAVADGVLALMALPVDDRLATGIVPAPGAAPLSARYAWYDVYRTADDRWVAVAAIEPRFWANLCRLLDLDELAGRQYDEGAQDDIRAALAGRFATRSRDEWVALLAAADTCVAPVLEIDEVADDPAFRARGAVTHARPPAGEPFAQLAPLLAGAERAAAYDVPAADGSDASALLAGAGFSTEEVAALLDEGTVR